MTGYAGSRGQCKFGDSARGLFAYQRASFACACNGARCNQIFPRCSSCARAHPARTVCRRVNRWRKLCRIPSPYSQVGTAVWHRRLFRIWSGNMRTWVAAGASNGNVHGHLARGMEPWSCWPAVRVICSTVVLMFQQILQRPHPSFTAARELLLRGLRQQLRRGGAHRLADRREAGKIAPHISLAKQDVHSVLL